MKKSHSIRRFWVRSTFFLPITSHIVLILIRFEEQSSFLLDFACRLAFLRLFYAISLRIYINWISNKRNGFIFHLLQWLWLVTIVKLNNKFYRRFQFNILANPSIVSMPWNRMKKPLERNGKLCVCVSHFAYIRQKKIWFSFHIDLINYNIYLPLAISRTTNTWTKRDEGDVETK